MKQWLKELADALCERVELNNGIGQMTWIATDEHGDFGNYVAVRPAPFEVVGGKDDGAVAFPETKVHLIQVMELFDEVDNFWYCSEGYGNSRHLLIEGRLNSETVIVEIYDEPAPNAKPASKLILEGGRAYEQ